MTTPPPYRNAALRIEERIDDLLARMTTAEKAAQCCQVRVSARNLDEISATVRAGGVGSLCVPGAQLSVAQLNELQRLAVEETRLGIPLIYGRDVIHGHRTVFPIPLAQAASWDPEMVEQAAAVAAREAASAAIHWTFTPMLDIARDPRWGRIAEGFGEDPHLGAAMAAAAVAGYQGEDPADPDRVLACAKHYVGYGAAESGRDYNAAEITDNTLRNVYLPPFRAAADAGVGSVMSSFQEIGGTPVSASRYLLSGVLREEWQWDGLVVSDAFAVEQLIAHGVAADRREATALAFNAGVDMDMWSDCYADHLEDLVESGEVSAERLDEAVRRVLRAKLRAGLFERPYTDPERAAQVQLCPEHRSLARRLAARCMVLLKNEGGVLPLSKGIERIAVLGPMIEDASGLMGCWSPDGVRDDVVTIADGIREALPDAWVMTCSAQSDVMLVHARRAEAVVLVVGENSCRSGEDNSAASIDLPPGQDALIEALHAMGRPLVVVVCAGRPLSINTAARLADAVLYAWHPGVEAGHAVADVLFGDAEPGGRLPVSVPRSAGQVPVHYDRKRTGFFFQPHAGGYVDLPREPLYPFGFGLGYTTFAYDELELSAVEVPVGGALEVSARVTNTGERAGETVAQCYIRDCVASTTRPVRELKGFRRVALGPGESRQVSFKLGPDELAFAGRDGTRRVEPGKFLIWVGADSCAELEAEFSVVG